VPAETDKRWMRAAIAQSRHAEGRTQTNPPVGCVILDKSGRLCAAAHTGIGGVPHAETQALDMAGKSAEGHGCSSWIFAAYFCWQALCLVENSSIA